MSSKAESKKGKDDDLNSELLLRDIEEISKALYLLPKAFNSSIGNRPSVTSIPSNSESVSKVVIHDSSRRNKISSIQSSSRKNKKSSIWNWNPLKALMHSHHYQVNCCFYLNVHIVEGLPSGFNGLNLFITWKPKGGILQTLFASVCDGMAEFEETLMHQCAIYANSTGNQTLAKYEPKLFLLHTYVIDTREQAVDIGKHWVDLTRLLPLTLEELGGAKRSSGKWTTSFKLSGKAEGAVLNVSFGFSVMDGKSFDPGYFVKGPDVVNDGGSIRINDSIDLENSRANQSHNLGSFLAISTQGSHHQTQPGTKFLDEIIPNRELELGKSLNLLYQKLDEERVQNSIAFDLFHDSSESVYQNSVLSAAGGNTRHACNDTGLNVIEHGEEVSMEDQVNLEQHDSLRFDSSLVEIIDIADIFEEDDSFDVDGERISKLDISGCVQDESTTHHVESKYQSRSDKESDVEERDSDSYGMLTSGPVGLDHFCYNRSNSRKSVSLLDIAESIENDFLNLLNIEQDRVNLSSDSGMESPRECLLRQFEEGSTALDNLFTDTDLLEEQEICSVAPHAYESLEGSDDFDFSFSIPAVRSNDHICPTWTATTGRNAKMLESQETESLMQEWGLNEKYFRNSPRGSSGGFGSPVFLSDEQPLKLPPLGEGLDPIIQTKDGGFLRSINPLLFQNATNDAKLIVQVSAPMVLPAEIGFTTMEILQYWASGGVEKMSVQVKELMPLEDITGKTIQQVVAETKSESDASKSWGLQHVSEDGPESLGEEKASENLPFVAQNSDGLYSCTNSEDIESEYVSLENLIPQAIQNIEGLLIEGLKVQSGMQCKDAPSSISIPFSANSGLEHDDLVKYSVSLEEWISLDSGGFDWTNGTDGNALRIFAAHCPNHTDFDGDQFVKEDDRVRLPGRKLGVFDKNFVMALKVQLRDPLRDYEMVGSNMLALIRVERVYSPLQPDLQCSLSEKSCKTERDGLDQNFIQEGTDFLQKQICREGIPRFKLLDAYLAGLNALSADKHLWGTRRQHQSGARWLFSSGIARTNKHHISNSIAVIKPSGGKMRKASKEDVLWSISAPSQGEAVPWDELVALNVHIRNPDIIFPN